jgi:hypothetical protein
MDIEKKIRELEALHDDFRQIAMCLEWLARTPAQRAAVNALRSAPNPYMARVRMFEVRRAFLSDDDGWIG